MEQMPQSNDIESRFAAFVNSDPEFKDKGFTPEEIHATAALLKEAVAQGTEDEVMKKAAEARLQVREVAGKIPVVNESTGEVIGMANSKQERDAMLLQDKGTRDAA